MHKKGSYNLDERRFPEGESEDERLNQYEPPADDQERILYEEKQDKDSKRKKRRKKKVKIISEMEDSGQNDGDYPSPIHHYKGDQNKESNIPLNDLRINTKTTHVNHANISHEALQQALNSLEYHQEIVPTTEKSTDVRHLAIQEAINRAKSGTKDRKRHTDYVLVHKTGDQNHSNNKLRETFEAVLEEEGLKIDRKYTTTHCFVVLHCPFERLCVEAEFVALEMPLAGYVVPEVGERSWLSKLGDKFKTDDEVDFISAPFCVSKSDIYEGVKRPDYFFRPALRSLLVHHILKTIDIRDKESRQLGQNPQGLPYLLLEGAYSDAFIVHEKSLKDKRFPFNDDGDEAAAMFYGQDIIDPRRRLDNTWLKWMKFQPLWKIRNYFGEQIALYFAWLGSLTFSLTIPMLFGLAVFLWGLIVAIGDNPLSEQNNSTLSGIISKWAKNAFDNAITPYFALIICLWGTIFLENWKRLNARLAYQWDVDNFEEQEPNRPEFYGTEVRPDPVTGNDEPFYPFRLRVFKMSGSFSLLLFMVCLVLASLFAVIVYRIIAREDLFKDRGAFGPTIASLTSTFLNTCSIMTMGKVYQLLAVKLTDWENHRTRTSYDDALIIKLFGFQFVNSYTSLFYIAFFRRDTADNGILGFGSAYNDACGANNDCMTLLSLQVAMLMIMKPLPKLLSDVIFPFIKRTWREHCFRGNRVDIADEINPTIEDYLDNEMHKEPVGDFTLSEYTEKVLQYGFLMLFAAAFPLAPLIALLTNLIDMKMDARRLLWSNRRPIALRAQDIGMWYGILEFLNIVGVVTNGFLVTFTSSYGNNWEGYKNTTITNNTSIDPMTNETTIEHVITQQPTFSRLWLLIGFEHIVFAFKFLIAWLIPDVPSDVRMAQRREKHHIADILDKAGIRKGPGNRLTESSSSIHRRLTVSKSSPGRLHTKQDQTTPTHQLHARQDQNTPTHRNDPHDTTEFQHTQQSNSPSSPHHENNYSSNKVHLQPLPADYLPKISELSKRQLDKVI